MVYACGPDRFDFFPIDAQFRRKKIVPIARTARLNATIMFDLWWHLKNTPT